MSRLRQRVAQRLKDSQNTYALLTTFQEVDMYEATNMRKVPHLKLRNWEKIS